MKLKTLMKKIEAANEVGRMTRSYRKFYAYVEMEHLTQRNIKTGLEYFDNWKDLLASLKDDWNDNVVWGIENFDLDEASEDTFEMYGDVYVKVTVVSAIY